MNNATNAVLTFKLDSDLLTCQPVCRFLAIGQTVEAFPKARLERAVVKLFEADRSLRDARPDDRIVMEQFILKMAGL